MAGWCPPQQPDDHEAAGHHPAQDSGSAAVPAPLAEVAQSQQRRGDHHRHRHHQRQMLAGGPLPWCLLRDGPRAAHSEEYRLSLVRRRLDMNGKVRALREGAVPGGALVAGAGRYP